MSDLIPNGADTFEKSIEMSEQINDLLVLPYGVEARVFLNPQKEHVLGEAFQESKDMLDRIMGYANAVEEAKNVGQEISEKEMAIKFGFKSIKVY